MILGCAAGILCSALEVVFPASLDRALALVGRIALPLALIAVGAGLDFGKLRAELAAASLVALLKLGAYPGLAYLGLRAIGLAGADLEVPVLIMASPTAVVSYIMAREMQGDEQLAGAIVMGTTTYSLLTVSVWLYLLHVA